MNSRGKESKSFNMFTCAPNLDLEVFVEGLDEQDEFLDT